MKMTEGEYFSDEDREEEDDEDSEEDEPEEEQVELDDVDKIKYEIHKWNNERKVTVTDLKNRIGRYNYILFGINLAISSLAHDNCAISFEFALG